MAVELGVEQFNELMEVADALSGLELDLEMLGLLVAVGIEVQAPEVLHDIVDGLSLVGALHEGTAAVDIVFDVVESEVVSLRKGSMLDGCIDGNPSTA